MAQIITPEDSRLEVADILREHIDDYQCFFVSVNKSPPVAAGHVTTTAMGMRDDNN